MGSRQTMPFRLVECTKSVGRWAIRFLGPTGRWYYAVMNEVVELQGFSVLFGNENIASVPDLMTDRTARQACAGEFHESHKLANIYRGIGSSERQKVLRHFTFALVATIMKNITKTHESVQPLYFPTNWSLRFHGFAHDS